MKKTPVFLAGALFALSLGSLPAGAQTKDAALDKLATDWAATFAKGDAKALAGFYTENGIRVTLEGGAVVGRAAIEKEFAANFAGPWKGAKIVIHPGSLQQVSPDIAVNEGTYEVTLAAGPKLSGRYLNTIVKKGGAWIVASNAAVAPPPPQ